MAARDAFTVHALNRCFDRLGFVPTIQESRAVMADIKAGRATKLRDHDSGTEVYLCAMRGISAQLVLSPADGCIVTVLEACMGLRWNKRGRNRQSFSLPPAYRNGARLKRRTVWL